MGALRSLAGLMGGLDSDAKGEICSNAALQHLILGLSCRVDGGGKDPATQSLQACPIFHTTFLCCCTLHKASDHTQIYEYMFVQLIETLQVQILQVLPQILTFGSSSSFFLRVPQIHVLHPNTPRVLHTDFLSWEVVLSNFSCLSAFEFVRGNLHGSYMVHVSMLVPEYKVLLLEFLLINETRLAY